MEKTNQEFINKLVQMRKTHRMVSNSQNTRPLNKEFVLLLSVVVFIAGFLGSWLTRQWIPILGGLIGSIILLIIVKIYKKKSQSPTIIAHNNNNNDSFRRFIVKDLAKSLYPQMEYIPNTARKKYTALPPNIEDIFRKDTKEEISYVAAQLLSNHAIYYRFELPFKSHNSILLFRKNASLFKKDGYTIRNPIALPIQYQSKTYKLYVQNEEYATYLVDTDFMDLILSLAHSFSEQADFEFFLKDNFLHISVQNQQDLFELNRNQSSEAQIEQTTQQLHQLLAPLNAFATKLSELMLIYKEKLPVEEVLDSSPMDEDDIYDHLIDF